MICKQASITIASIHMVTGRNKEQATRRLPHMINQLNEQIEELQLLATVDQTRRIEDELDLHTWQLEDEAKQGCRRRRLSFALAVRKRRFARNSLLIGSRYGVWSSAERRFIKRTNLYHYHHITQGIRDLRNVYIGVFMDGFCDVSTLPALLYRFLFVHPRRAVRIMRALLLYYHVFMAKDRRMECWLDNVYGGDVGGDREELSSLRHRLVDVYRGRMTPAQRQRLQVIYARDRLCIWCCFGVIVFAPLVLFVIIAWLLK